MLTWPEFLDFGWKKSCGKLEIKEAPKEHQTLPAKLMRLGGDYEECRN